MKYRYYFNRRIDNLYHAGSKLFNDLAFFAEKSLGCSVVNIPVVSDSNKYKRIIHKLFFYLYNFLRMPWGAQAIFPYDGWGDLLYVTKLFKLKNISVVYIIIDIDSFRFSGKLSLKEITLLNSASVLIVHTPAMKIFLCEAGVTTPMFDINLFDYNVLEDKKTYLDDPNDTTFIKNVVFAGNLEKSLFVRQLSNIAVNTLKYSLYGNLNSNCDFASFVFYEGKFHPDRPTMKKGWGLVWDGDSIFTCKGYLGDYLRVNLPHKTCLYLAAGMPVIVWKEAAISSYILKNNLGLAVSSLNEIEDVIDNLSKDEYENIRLSVFNFSQKLRKGEMLNNIFKRIEI